ncbi:hypothetical protein [Acetobacter orleanensis]|uniref:Uncharacterized protein n=1 Tax=Acetobacter orleanensis TaxID=104099 RepID=A0A4Y3TPI7_9PROT|nr:hypothetical protein [Acetobacter orleanensis]KXV63538.1 hypothetical protein AD949_07025 [Acetobacter orleanensis]PCD79897.1 hypothetical protein CO710_03250 [Acetobacter orleanensis]GAN68197.1 hypothetical protein Abol_015_036 [Acetobacter orleanensis JCM 7639]GBR31437.1 hypothetical protein AA0473_2541 [Acetobacter orleanensis NRIC 0473]GEB82910.1 hypothetical protein AOR01nite_13870 [Acetobacter orleanensis]
MAQLRKPSLLLLTGLCLGFSLATGLSVAKADPALTPDDNISFGEGSSSQSDKGSTEKKTVHGHRSLPPGYQDAPSMEFNHGADPDHLAKVHRDAVTGTDLSRYGSAYETSGPYGSGQMGDATGNGWVTPR